jgi:hypothetical protein
MTVYIYKNTGKIMSVMFETKDVVDANGNIKPSGNTDDNSEADPDIPTEPDPTDPIVTNNVTGTIVFRSGNTVMLVLICTLAIPEE